LIDRQADIAEDASQRSLGDVAVAVYRDGGSPPVWMAHDLMTAAHPRGLEAVPLQCPNDS
jgi:hypothetical protein